VVTPRSDWSTPLRDQDETEKIRVGSTLPTSRPQAPKSGRVGASVVAIFQPPSKSGHLSRNRRAFWEINNYLSNQIHIYSWEAVTIANIVRLQPPEILASSTSSLDLYQYSFSSNEKEEKQSNSIITAPL